ncbi:protein Atg16l2-like [Pseudochaenichthys georgianus]|uniref:protein Atg16l2-like n=1 Tax=Pseudochaenichthys georgianus TaxID=52239 RepID=UPI00146D2F23|nr:autophagy-related protein 16-2-like [Pseudochaenichthys georgianus]XP_033933971.1 autophagy-related protein 16-2-like [Pseudochaenichthys georgianus]
MASGALRGGGRAAETRWRRHIVGQLKLRDRRQHDKFQDLIRFYTRLLEKTSLTPARRPSSDSSLSALLHQNNQLKNTTGELAYQVVQLQQQIKIKDSDLEEQHARQQQEEPLLQGAFDSRLALQGRVDKVRGDMGALKSDYDTLLERQKGAETKLREEKLRGGNMLQEVIHLKQQEAANMNTRNERRCRAREAARSKVTVETSGSAPTSRSSSPRRESERRLFRSASATSPRILTSIRALFQRRRGQSVSSLQEDQLFPVGICLSARLPVRALHVLEAHEQGINAVRFNSSSELLATGGTDRAVKLWDVRAGSLTHRATLDGSTEGVTCIEFDPKGPRVLAASYDKSALLWRLDDPVPKVTLTGHSRRVTAARFGLNLQVVTGSADRTVRLWDLQRACCVQVVEVPSYCSDLICTGYCIISGHYDSKIRVWDTRAVRCIQELPAHGKVTSLDISPDHCHLLSCCRDDCLQLIDLRGRSYERVCFRADGFKCGSDSTKAVISPDGCFLAAGSADGAVYIWNVSTGNLETRLPDKHSSSISAVSWSPSGEYVVSVDLSRRAVLWRDV